GLGRYFGVDPILFRIAFVVLTFAGGVGVLAYIGLLAFVPADDDSRPFGQRRDANMIGAVLLGIVVLLILGPPFFFVGPALIPIAIVIGIGLLLWRASGGTVPSGGDPGRLIARGVIALLIGIAAVGAFAGVFILAALGGGTTLAILAILAGVGRGAALGLPAGRRRADRRRPRRRPPGGHHEAGRRGGHRARRHPRAAGCVRVLRRADRRAPGRPGRRPAAAPRHLGLRHRFQRAGLPVNKGPAHPDRLSIVAGLAV